MERDALLARVAELEEEIGRHVKLYQDSQANWHRRQENWRASSEREASQLRATVERVRDIVRANGLTARQMRSQIRSVVFSAAPALAPASPSWSKPITDWQRETFGEATPDTAYARAREEWDELVDGHCEDWEPAEQAEEAADVVITLAAFVRAHGFDLAEVVERKMAKNRARKWVTRGDGTGDHVKEGEES